MGLLQLWLTAQYSTEYRVEPADTGSVRRLGESSSDGTNYYYEIWNVETKSVQHTNTDHRAGLTGPWSFVSWLLCKIESKSVHTLSGRQPGWVWPYSKVTDDLQPLVLSLNTFPLTSLSPLLSLPSPAASRHHQLHFPLPTPASSPLPSAPASPQHPRQLRSPSRKCWVLTARVAVFLSAGKFKTKNRNYITPFLFCMRCKIYYNL